MLPDDAELFVHWIQVMPPKNFVHHMHRVARDYLVDREAVNKLRIAINND